MLFRLVNDKMMEDIKIAREEGIHQKCLEHRLKLSSDNEIVLMGTYVLFYFYFYFFDYCIVTFVFVYYVHLTFCPHLIY